MGKACVFHIRHIRRFSKVRSLSKDRNEVGDEPARAGGRVPQAERTAEMETCSMARWQERHE